MKEKKVWIILWVPAIVALVLFFMQQQITETESTNNNGRDKIEIAAGETLMWEWTPSFETDTVYFWVGGTKKANGIVLKFMVSENDLSIASAEWKVMEEKNYAPVIQGVFHSGKKYNLVVEASGKGSIKLRGSKEDDHFIPFLRTNGKTIYRNHLWLYLFLVLALLPLMPVPDNQ